MTSVHRVWLQSSCKNFSKEAHDCSSQGWHPCTKCDSKAHARTSLRRHMIVPHKGKDQCGGFRSGRMLEFTEWYEGWMIQVLGTMSIPMLGDSRCLARWPGGLVEPAVLHYSSYLFSEKFGWVKNTWSFLAVGSESLATPGRKGVRHLGFLILESRWLLQKTSKCIVDKGFKDWKYKNHPSRRSVST